MENYQLVCTKCDESYNSDSERFRCSKCNSILEVKYDYSTLKLQKDFKKRKITQSKYSDFFPISEKLASLGEGGTKLVKITRLGNRQIKDFKLYLKVESNNPTKTFKDRGSSVEITKAKELDLKEVCCASTGNMGLSVATYSRRHRMKCTIFISKYANAEKIEKIRKQKAKVVLVKGDFNAAIRNAEKFAQDNRTFLCGDYHYRKEGQKSVVFETIEQLKYKVPDYIFAQIGNGTLFAAVFKGLQEFKILGLISRLPKLVAVQSKECDPLVKAYKEGKSLRYVKPKTKADAIAVGYPVFGFEGLKAIKSTKGDAVSPSDSEIEKASSLIYDSAGIEAELGGATSFAGFLEMYNKDKLTFKNKTVVAIMTGNNED